ncbi:MAG: hypothetical protein HYT40_03645 [Candidatus Sungbacteria bacterium]|uniref:Uncharacterized protein n=1 Tax=Candidatus Sungiibacteriota bacterium TaxID=2750080 RepID=A0A931WND9_9BACT|nr:hypothetical protein [Candidatus Sungbacteria bacterium]
MAEIETAYLRAKDYEKSPQFATDRLNALEKIRSILRMGTVTEPEALLAIGRLQQVILDTFAHEAVIAEYDGLKKTLKEMFP